MSVCNRCGVSAWHPEVRSCPFTDCELRAAQLVPAANVDALATIGTDPFGGGAGEAGAHANSNRILEEHNHAA